MKFNWEQEITKKTNIPVAVKEDLHNKEYKNIYFFETEFAKEGFLTERIKSAIQRDEYKIKELIGEDYQTNIILPNRKFKIIDNNEYYGMIVKVKYILTPKNKDKVLANKRILIVYNYLTEIFIYQEKIIKSDDEIKTEEDERDKNVKMFFMNNNIIEIKDGIYYKGTMNIVDNNIKWTSL